MPDLLKSFRTLILRSNPVEKEISDYGQLPPSNPFLLHQQRLEHLFSYLLPQIGSQEVELSGVNQFSDFGGLLALALMIKNHGGHTVIHVDGRTLADFKFEDQILTSLKENEVLGFVITFDRDSLRIVNSQCFEVILENFRKNNFKLFYRYRILSGNKEEESENLKQYISYYSKLLSVEMTIERTDVYHFPQKSDLSMPLKGIVPVNPCQGRLHFVATSDGIVYPCIIGSLNPQFAIGNWINEEISVIAERINHLDKLRILINEGPRSLIGIERISDAKKILDRPYLNVCHACRILHSSMICTDLTKN